MIRFIFGRISKKNLVFLFVISVFSILAAFRTPNLNDYQEYFQWYIDVPNISSFLNRIEDLPVPTDVLFFLILSIFKSIDFWRGFLWFVFFLSITLKYYILRERFNSFEIIAFLLVYFGLMGLQFELVQFRFGLAVSFLLYFIFSKNILFLILSIFTHFGITAYAPGIILAFLFNIFFSNHQIKILLILAILLHNLVFWGIIDLGSFYNLDFLIFNQYLFGKLNNQFLFATSAFSVITFVRNLIEVAFLLLLKDNFINKWKFLYRITVCTYFVYIFFLPIDNLNARLMPLIEIGFLIIFFDWIKQKFKSNYTHIIIFSISLMFFLFSLYYFLSTATMLPNN